MKIMDIKRFAVHDGDGIRTTIFFKGCPLRCVWCHNPEGLEFETQIAYFSHKCANCGICSTLCGANTFENGVHTFNAERCDACSKCESECPAGAFKIFGKDYSADELLKIALEDMAFYESSGGGVTLSGGECLMQYEDCKELLKKLKDHNINTAVDTSGYAKKEAFDAVAPYTDIFLYDIKAIDEDVHIKCTGKSNKIILDNLIYLDQISKKAEIRVPFVPGFNDDQMRKIAEFLSGLNNITNVKILPFHNFSDTKYSSLQMTSIMPHIAVPTSDALKKAQKEFEVCDIPVKIQ